MVKLKRPRKTIQDTVLDDGNLSPREKRKAREYARLLEEMDKKYGEMSASITSMMKSISILEGQMSSIPSAIRTLQGVIRDQTKLIRQELEK
jgi:hypothetical protein